MGGGIRINLRTIQIRSSICDNILQNRFIFSAFTAANIAKKTAMSRIFLKKAFFLLCEFCENDKFGKKNAATYQKWFSPSFELPHIGMSALFRRISPNYIDYSWSVLSKQLNLSVKSTSVVSMTICSVYYKSHFKPLKKASESAFTVGWNKMSCHRVQQSGYHARVAFCWCREGRKVAKIGRHKTVQNNWTVFSQLKRLEMP